MAALLLSGLATFAVLDPFHLRHSGPAAAVLVALAVVAVTWLALRWIRGRAARIVAVLAGSVVMLGWIGMVWLSVSFAGPERVVDEVASEAGQRLVLIEGRAFSETVFSVRLRSGSGPFEQESLVWQGLADGAAPEEVRFGDQPDQVEVVSEGGCGYRSTFDATTLDVDPVFRPLRLDGC